MNPRSRDDAATRPILRREVGELRLYFEDDFLQSRMCEDDPDRLVLAYTRFMMGFLLFRPKPERIAMIGLGGGSVAKYCHAHLPATDFTAIEISAKIIALRDTFAIPPDGPTFRVFCEDGADWVRRPGPPVDALLVDAFDVDGLPPELSTAGFYDACRARLADGGVLVVNLHPDDASYDDYVDRLRDAFDGAIAVVTVEESDNRIVFAGAGRPFPPPVTELARRLRLLAPQFDLPLEEIVRTLLAGDAPRRPRRRRRA